MVVLRDTTDIVIVMASVVRDKQLERENEGTEWGEKWGKDRRRSER